MFTRLIFFISCSFLGIGILVMFFSLSNKPILIDKPLISTFYPKYIDSNCKTKISLLNIGKLKVDKYLIGFYPDWKIDSYDIHSLRFLDCLIREAEQGDIKSFNLAKQVILDWDKKNKFAEKIDNWTWKDNKSSWSEHGVSWRAVLLSYFYRVVQILSPEDQRLIIHLQKMAKAHGDFLSFNRVYLSDHNHGLNNAMGLLALGTTFRQLPDAHKWVNLSFTRAEQQMSDNVSIDGVHLEQSGFYHFYTLRTFMELYEVAQALGRPLSNKYRQKLDKMLELAALMAGSNRRVEGIPWSNHEMDVFNYLKSVDSLNLGTSAPGKRLFEKVRQGYSVKGLFVKSEGGYSFFTGRFGKELEIIFHTRILLAPHFQADALGLTAILGNQRILTYGNYSSTSRKANDFNIVQVSSLKQGSTLRLKRKVPLRKRLVSKGGEVLAFGSLPKLDFVTARSQAYAGVIQTRTVARIGTHYLLVWDRLQADKEYEYTQTFHFAAPIKVVVNSVEGVAKLQEKPIAHFLQLEKGIEVKICDVRSQVAQCNWKRDRVGKLTHPSEVSYRTVGKKAEFLWVMYAGVDRLKAQVKTVNNNESQVKIVTLSGKGGDYEVRLQGVKLNLQFEGN